MGVYSWRVWFEAFTASVIFYSIPYWRAWVLFIDLFLAGISEGAQGVFEGHKHGTVFFSIWGVLAFDSSNLDDGLLIDAMHEVEMHI